MAAGDEALIAEILARNAGDTPIYRLCEQFTDQYDNLNNWQPESNGEITLLRKVLPNCRRVFDVGAHTGAWSEAALAINPALEIHCFEASVQTHKLLVERTPPLRVIANAFGLGSKAETRTLYSFGEGNNANSLYRRNGIEVRGFPPQDKTETATLVRCDDYCAEHGIGGIDFMKIDTEGHELHVLEGARGLLSKQAIGAIQFEYGGCNIDSRGLLRDLFDFFRDLRYIPAKNIPDHIALMAEYDPRPRDFPVPK